VTIKRFMLARAAAAAVGPRAGGAGSRTASHAWNGRSTAPFAAECQSEVDETFVGGLAKNKHKDKRGKGGGTGGVGSGKTPIVGAVKRKGNVIARVIENVRADTLCDFVREAVSHKVSLLCTDQWKGYRKLDKEYPHATIDHSKGQYVIGAVHTQTIEGFWSIFKRGVMGTFHKMSAKYMPLYVAEFQFRYNNRENADIFGTAIEGC